MEQFFFDLRYSVRRLRKASAFAAVVILTLALGIGANTAIYSVVDAVVIRPLPFAEPDRLVMVFEDSSFLGFPRNTPAPANFFDWKARNRVFTDMAVTRGAVGTLTGGGAPEQVIGRRVSGNFFSVLGAQPLLGRTFTDDDDRSGAPVTVLSYGLWQRRFGGSPSVIGTEVVMNGSGRTVIGVMPKAFAFRNREVDFWNTSPLTPAEASVRGSHYLNVVARLKPGATLEQARGDMSAIAAQLEQEYPDTNRRVGAVVVPIKEDVLGDTRLQLLVLLAASGCVLLIACANVGSLMLSRALTRTGELAVRRALGADSGRLVRQMVIEAMLLAVAGGILGLLLAPLGAMVLTGLVPTALPAETVSRLDPRLLTFTVAITFATGLLFSVVPAVRATRASINEALHEGGRGGVGGRRTLARDALVVGQVAAAVALLVGAGLLLQTLANLRAIDLGFRTENLLTLRTSLPQPKYADPIARLAFYERVVAGVRALPGVESADYVSTLPFQSIGNTNSYRIEGRPPEQGLDSLMRVGTNGYLKTLGVELVEGRLPDERDHKDAPPVAVVNETFARMHWPGRSPLGARVAYSPAATAPWRTIVGVVKDVRERGYELGMKPATYLPYAQVLTSWFPESLLVRTSGDPAAVVGAVRQVIGSVDPEQPIAAVRTMEEIVDLDVIDRTQQTTLIGAFAGLALLLAALGLYGVLSYGVAQRQREIGLRMALGATRGSVVRLIVSRGLALMAIGLAVGTLLAWAGSRAIATLLYGVGAGDASTFAAVVAILGAVTVAACSLPAARASRVDPMTVLRQE
jgi:putative ABC transport system permease protein